MLRARGQTQFFRSCRAESQDPVREPVRIEQLARFRLGALAEEIRVASVFFVKPPDGSVEAHFVLDHGGGSISENAGNRCSASSLLRPCRARVTHRPTTVG